MFGEKGESNKYVVLLFSVLAFLVFGNLMIEFNISDLIYLCFIGFMTLRYIKIRILK